MGVVEDKLKELKKRETKTLQMGGEKAVAKQHEKNKLTARERMGSSPVTVWSMAGRCLRFLRILRPEAGVWGRCIPKKYAK